MRFRDQGFTILEIMVVLLVLALVVAITYPSLSRGSSTLHMRTCGRDVLNIFRYAREKAVTEQTGMIVTVDRDRQALTLSDNLGRSIGRAYSMPSDVRIHRMALGGTEVSEGSLAVRYLPNGSADQAEVLLLSETGAQLRIVSDPMTGGARIESEQGENVR
jgi:prepilin-type N-terminal cleavage/methylation domain-containing protein